MSHIRKWQTLTLLYAHVQTWRPYTLWHAGLVGVAGAALVSDRHNGWQLLAAWSGPTLGWVSGHYLGDYLDRRLDAISKPHRPIPSGRLRPSSALRSGLICLIAAGCIGLLLNWRTVGLVAVAAVGILAYSGLLKGRGLAGNAMRGTLTAVAFLFGSMTVEQYPPWWVLPFAAIFSFHDAASNLVGTLRDVAGDREAGYRTLPVHRGMRAAIHAAVLLYSCSLAMAAICWWALARPGLGYPSLLILSAGLGLIVFARLLRNPDGISQVDALRAHELLVVERLILTGAVLSLGVGVVLTLALVVPAVIISLMIQTAMRANYEFAPPAVAVSRRRDGGEHVPGLR